MATEHCTKCSPGSPCGHGHLYVIEFHSEAAQRFQNEANGYLYVGSTSLSVEQRFADNFKRNDGSYITPEGLLVSSDEWPEDGQWKYNSPNSKRIRRHYLCHRPDLLYLGINPVISDGNDPGKLVRWEANLAGSLRNRGWRVEGPKR